MNKLIRYLVKFLLLSVVGVATTQADVVFKFGPSDSYVTADRNFQRTATQTSTDPSYVFTNAFSDGSALSPTVEYSGPTFYGGYDFSSSTIDAGFSREQVRTDNATYDYDQIFLQSYNGAGWTGSNLGLHALFLFKQEDFNTGFETGVLSVDGLSVSWNAFQAGTSADRSLEGYFVVGIGSSYYISQTTFSMLSNGSYSISGTDLSSEMWAAYDPASSLDFDQSSAVYNSLDLDGVTSVGVYAEDDQWTVNTGAAAAYALGIDSLQVDGAIIPEPAHMSIMLGMLCLLGLVRFRRAKA